MKKILILTLWLVSFSAVSADIFDLFDTSTSTTPVCKTAGTQKVCNIYLLDNIKAPDAYLEQYKILTGLNTGDTVYLHLTGPGGQGDGLIYLLNAIKKSKAKVVSVVDGNVASCAAVLAVATGDILMTGDAYIFFHNISGSNMTNEICRQETGSDRGLAAYTKCIEDVPKITSFYNSVINRYVYPILTAEEKVQYDQGHDIIIDGQELLKRMGKVR